MSSAPSELNENLALVRARIAQAAKRAGRRSEKITLIAVSKTHSARKIQKMFDVGVRHFGENRVQERESKLAALTSLDITWHMIGHVQRNKAARAAQLFHSIDSVDSVALAEKLDRARAESIAENLGKSPQQSALNEPHFATAASRLRVLIEVKLDPQPAKSGAMESELARLAEAIIRLPNLELRGLMGVPPYFDDPDEARPYFQHLREIRDALRRQLGSDALPVLSMGMSHDFEIAIEEGATEVRVGTALFGERERV